MKLPVVDMSRWHLPELRASVLWLPDEPVPIVSVFAKIRHVQTGVVGHIQRNERLSLTQFNNPRNLKAQIRATITELILHELDECLYIDGERLCAEPHPELSK